MNIFTRLLVIFLFSAACITQVAAGVYKRTNPDGSVEFTDVPNRQNQEPVKLSPISTFEAPPTPPPQASATEEQPDTITYEEVRITSPANEATIRENINAIPISVSVTPALSSGHKLILLMDGAKKGEFTSGSFTLSGVDRGSHSLSAQVVDKEGEELISSPPVTIFLHRASVANTKRIAK